MTGGDRPAHLDRCDLCAERAVDLARWMDAAREDASEASDAVFTPDRLAAQQSQILRRLEQVDSPARVISFPATLRAERGEVPGRRVAVSWVGVAAAAGIAIGIVGGQVSARLMQKPQPPCRRSRPSTPPLRRSMRRFSISPTTRLSSRVVREPGRSHAAAVAATASTDTFSGPDSGSNGCNPVQ